MQPEAAGKEGILEKTEVVPDTGVRGKCKDMKTGHFINHTIFLQGQS